MKSRWAFEGTMVIGALYASLTFALRREPVVHDWIAFSNGVLDPLLYRFFVDHTGLGYVETPWMASYQEIARHLYYASSLLGLLLLIGVVVIAFERVRGMRAAARPPVGSGNIALIAICGILAVATFDLVAGGRSFSGFETAPPIAQVIRVLQPLVLAAIIALLLDQLAKLWTRRAFEKAHRDRQEMRPPGAAQQ